MPYLLSVGTLIGMLVLTESQASREYRLADTMIDMAEVLITGRQALIDGADAAEKKSDFERDFEVLLSYEKAITRFREARDLVVSFETSEDEDIRFWANTTAVLCQALEGAFRESLKMTTEAMEASNERELRALIPKIAANAARIDEIWRTFPKVMALVSHVVHDGERTDAAGKVSFLKISPEEKRLLLQRLDAMSLGPDKEGNRLAVEAGLGIFRDFLREPWKH